MVAPLLHTHNTPSHPTPHTPSYLSLARFNAKFERAYVEQAREDVQWERRQKECLDNERDLMQHAKGWVVGGRRYFTQWEDKPDKDVLDQRVSGAQGQHCRCAWHLGVRSTHTLSPSHTHTHTHTVQPSLRSALAPGKTSPCYKHFDFTAPSPPH